MGTSNESGGVTCAFTLYLTRWNLTPDGESIHTHSSDLLPVLLRDKRAMLKVARSDEEVTGNTLMVWLEGTGAARVYAHDGPGLLMERLDDVPSLAELVRVDDDGAARILCAAAARIHEPRPNPAPELPTLRRWFGSLERAATQGGMLRRTWEVALALLDGQVEVRPLHGDIHHRNVLHSALHSAVDSAVDSVEGRGWLAIDPKGILGERTYDYANIFCNPDRAFALQPGRLARLSHVVAAQAGLERPRLLAWIAAYAGLSAAWWLEDSDTENAALDFRIAELALAELDD